jgi:hypothetical protein
MQNTYSYEDLFQYKNGAIWFGTGANVSVAAIFLVLRVVTKMSLFKSCEI